MLVNIYRDPNIVENIFIGAYCTPKEVTIYINLFKYFCDVFACSYKEILGIDPNIIQNVIKAYKYVKLILHKL